MQRPLQDGFASCLPHHGRVDEPAITHLQDRSLSGAVAVVPPLDEFMACDEVALGSWNIRYSLRDLFRGLHYAFLHTFSIVSTATEATVSTRPMARSSRLARRAGQPKEYGGRWGSFLRFLTLRARHGCDDTDTSGTRLGGYRAHPGMADKVKRHAFDHRVTQAIDELRRCFWRRNTTCPTESFMRRTHVLSAPVVILLVIRLFVLLAMRNTSSMAQFVSQRRERSMKMDTGEIIVTAIIVAIGILAYWVINSNDN